MVGERKFKHGQRVRCTRYNTQDGFVAAINDVMMDIIGAETGRTFEFLPVADYELVPEPDHVVEARLEEWKKDWAKVTADMDARQRSAEEKWLEFFSLAGGDPSGTAKLMSLLFDHRIIEEMLNEVTKSKEGKNG